MRSQSVSADGSLRYAVKSNRLTRMENVRPEQNIRAKGKGYEARMTIQGIAYSAYGPSKREAVERLEEKVNGCLGIVPDSLTLRLLMEKVYLPTIELQKPATKDKVRWSISRLGKLAHMKIEDLTRHNIQREVNDLAKTLSPGSIRTVTQPWNAALNLAEADRLIPHNPMRHIKLPAVTKKPKDTLTREELLKLLAASRGYSSHGAIVLGCFLGLRIGEIRALRAAHFAKPGVLIVPGTKTAASKRELPLHPRVLAEIAGLPLPLVGTWGTGISQAMNRSARRAGIKKHIHPHLCRHTFITLLQWIGCPIEIRGRLAGHAETRVTQGYSHAEWQEWALWTSKLVTFVYEGVGINLGTERERVPLEGVTA